MGSGSGEFCFESGGPDWLFSAMLAAGLVAVVYGLSLVVLFEGQGKPPVTGRRRLWPAGNALIAIVVMLGFELVVDPFQAIQSVGLAVVLGSPAIATLMVMVRRSRTTGVFPQARDAPLGMFWVFLALTVLGVLVAIAALYAQFALSHAVPCT